MNKQLFERIADGIFGRERVACAPNDATEGVNIDDPLFAQLDPSLSYDEVEAPSRGRSPLRPPGFDGLMNTIKSITKRYDHVKGFRFEVGWSTSNNFHISNNWSIRPPVSNPMKASYSPATTYQLALQYIGGDLKLPTDQPTFIMTGRMESSGRLEAAIIKPLRNWLTIRFNGMFQTPEMNEIHLDFDIDGKDCLSTIKLGNAMFSVNFMQSIGRNLACGFEMMHIPMYKLTKISYAGRYIWGSRNFYFNYNPLQANLNIASLFKLTKKAQLVTELEINTKNGETDAVLGYRQRFQTSEVVLTANSRGKVSSLINLLGGMYSLKLCVIGNYWKDTYKFGYAFGLGQVH